MANESDLQAKTMGNIMYTMALAQDLILLLADEGLVPARKIGERLDAIALQMDLSAADPQQQHAHAVSEARQRLDTFMKLFTQTTERMESATAMATPTAHEARVVDIVRRAGRRGAAR